MKLISVWQNVFLIIKQHIGVVEIPYILTLGFNDRYTSYREGLTWHALESSMELATCNMAQRCLACAWDRLHISEAVHVSVGLNQSYVAPRYLAHAWGRLYVIPEAVHRACEAEPEINTCKDSHI